MQYQPLTLAKKDKDNFLGHQVPYGKIWEPGKQPLTLFTNSPLTIAGASVPVGAYTIYLIPNKKAWTLVVSKNTNTSAAYDQGMDIVRAPMQVGILTSPEQRSTVSFEHPARRNVPYALISQTSEHGCHYSRSSRTVIQTCKISTQNV